MKKLTMASLFAGIGGFELAATWAGIKPIWSNEIDPWCCKVLRKNFTHEIIEKDIRDLYSDTKCTTIGYDTGNIKNGKGRDTPDGFIQMGTNNEIKTHELKPVDILTGGFPCQPFSHAGKRKGKDDNRYLWPEYLRLIRELQPTWVIAENVAGLISMENGKTLEGILLDLENENYTPEIYNIPACGVGAWHKRERIWIVSHSVNSTDRTNRGQSQKENRLQEINRPEGLPGEFSRTGCEVQDVSDSNGKGLQAQRKPEGIRETKRKARTGIKRRSMLGREWIKSWWQFEPAVGRVANGISKRVDRLKGLGNAIVPQVAFQIFKAIVEYEKSNIHQVEMFE